MPITTHSSHHNEQRFTAITQPILNFVLSTEYSVLSTQYSVLSTQYALIARHLLPRCLGIRVARRFPQALLPC